MPAIIRWRMLALLVGGLSAAARLPAQGGRGEARVPQATRAAVVEMLTRRLAPARWQLSDESDYEVRFERSGTRPSDMLGHPVGPQITDRVRFVFHDAGDTLQITGLMETVWRAHTATERRLVREDSTAMRQVAAMLAAMCRVAPAVTTGAGDAGLCAITARADANAGT